MNDDNDDILNDEHDAHDESAIAPTSGGESTSGGGEDRPMTDEELTAEVEAGVGMNDPDDQQAFYADVFAGLRTIEQNAILALVAEPDMVTAAKRAGVTRRTLYRWLGKEHFSKAYREARRMTFLQAISLTQRYLPLAINTIAKIMVDPRAPATARVSAASTVLKFGRDSIELDELANRIETLERAARERERSGPANGWRAA